MREAIAQFARELDLVDLGLVLGVLAIVGAALGWLARRALKRARILEDTPTSLIRSAAQGYCELTGHAELLPGATVRAPLSGGPCCWWRYEVAEKVRSGKNTRWQAIEADVSGALFALDDPTGRCVVDPDGADVIPSRSATWYGDGPRPMTGPDHGARWSLGHRYRYREEVVLPESALFAIGWFETHADPHTSSDAQRELAHKLAQWKQQPGHLAARFDRDGDGRIGLDEWEAVRAAAKTEVAAELAERALAPGVNLLKRPRDGRPFLLSTIPQPALVARCRWQARGGLAGLALVVWLVVEILNARGA